MNLRCDRKTAFKFPFLHTVTLPEGRSSVRSAMVIAIDTTQKMKLRRSGMAISRYLPCAWGLSEHHAAPPELGERGHGNGYNHGAPPELAGLSRGSRLRAADPNKEQALCRVS